MKRFLVLSFFALAGCSSPEPEPVVVAPTEVPSSALASAMVPVPTLAPSVPVVTSEPQTLPSTPIVTPAPPRTVTAIVSDAFSQIEAATTLSQLAAIRGDLATASLSMDKEVRRASVGRDSERAMIAANIRQAIDLPLRAARAKYEFLDGTSVRQIVDHALDQKTLALNLAQRCDYMIANPGFSERERRQSEQAGTTIQGFAERDRRRLQGR